MDIVIAKAVADLIKPITEPLSKKIFEHRGTGGTIITAALESRLAQVLTTADIADLSDRMVRRSKQISIRKQLSYENAVALALELAASTPEDRRRPVEADWFMKWSESVQDVSDEMIQSLWAQAFARQTDSGSRQLSLRALDTLRLMDRSDAISFLRMKEVLDAMGVILVNTNEIIERLIKPECFDALLDLRLIEYDEQLTSVFSAPGGYTMYFDLPPERSREPVRIIRMSVRGHELAQTLPADQEADYPYRKAFDVNDPLLIPKYLSLVADSFSDDYHITLSIHEQGLRRPPRGRRRNTHEWNHSIRAWERVSNPDHNVDHAIIDELERCHNDVSK